MKTIGLIGGTSWPSTVRYYEVINRLVVERLGGYHSAKLILWNIDYHAIRSLYHHGWESIPELLANEINEFVNRCHPHNLILCNNTLHRAFDRAQTSLALDIPFFHGPRLVAQVARKEQRHRVLLLGTPFIMEDDYYASILAQEGVKTVIPDRSERESLGDAQRNLACGSPPLQHAPFFSKLLRRYEDHVDAVVLGCTELPLAISQEHTRLPLLDPILLQCKAVVEHAVPVSNC